MSLVLPAADSPLRELFDLNELAKLGAVSELIKLPSHLSAKRSAARTFASDRAVRKVNVLVLRANGELWLEQFGPLGGWACLWNFGKVHE